MKYYAVQKGYQKGVFTSWSETQKHVKGFSGAVYKSFQSKTEAENFVEGKIGKPQDLNKWFSSETIQPKSKPEPKLENEQIELIPIKTVKKEFDIGSSELNIYTDGSLIKKGKLKGCGYGVFIPNYHVKVSQKLKDNKTNNRAELSAIIWSLEWLRLNKELIRNHSKINIYTDSRYSLLIVGGTGRKYLANGFMRRDPKKGLVPAPNKDLIKLVINLLNEVRGVSFHHVYSHTSKNDIHSQGNQIADKLAVSASKLDLGIHY